jgi:pimeloyl-ACP methyl ester carboxylesterase
LVFLAGGGHTAHEFDEFAPRLADAFRVIGITRRGVGASSSSRHRVARDAITDIASVLDALDVDSAVLVGHSQGGMEAAYFAYFYPERCLGVVHLDSAYLGGPPDALEQILRRTPPPEPPPKTSTDSASTAAMQAWIERTQGFRLPESELRARSRIDQSGRIVGSAPRNTEAKYRWFGKLPTLRWESIMCPGLGLYAVTAPLETWMPHYASRLDSLSADERSLADAYVRAFSTWTAARRAEFAQWPQNRVIEFRATGHYFFLEHPEQEQTLAAIRDFATQLELR